MHDLPNFSNFLYVQAFNDGAAAFREGQTRFVHPSSETYAAGWFAGWDDAFMCDDPWFSEQMLTH